MRTLIRIGVAGRMSGQPFLGARAITTTLLFLGRYTGRVWVFRVNKGVPSRRAHQKGFSLLELALVLVVVGLLLGAVSLGKDLHRGAEQQIIHAKFIQAWAVAYNEYFARTGVVVGDSQTSPTLKVNGDETILCDTNANPSVSGELHDLMDQVGIEMPPGRAEGKEDRYIYLDTNGNPQEIRICFKNVAWPDSDDVSLNNKNAMIIRGLNPDLARNLDAAIDGRPDARFGLFREANLPDDPTASAGGTVSLEWSDTNQTNFGGSTTNRDEDQVVVLTAVYRMNQ